MKNALIFTGQGSFYTGMGKDLYDNFTVAKEIFRIGSKILDKDLENLCFNGTTEELSPTINAQPAIFCVSIAAFMCLKDKVSYDAVLGHSLGEYAAMVASNIISVEDGFRLIKHRATAMDRCAKNQNSGMCAVLSKNVDKIKELCEKINGFITPVNYNSLAQTVVAGEKSAIDEMIILCKAEKIKAISLAVSAAFHSKLMEPAANEFIEKIADIKFNKPVVDFYSNVTGDKMNDFDNMPAYLAKHIVSPVMFVSELNALKDNGFTNFIEVGPLKTISGLVKKTLDDVNIFNIENCADIKNLNI